MLGVAQLPALGLATFLLFLLMGCLGLGNGSVFQLVPQRFGKRVGVATGILGAAGGLGGFFLPTVVGAMKQLTGSYSSGLGIIAALAVIALAVLALVQGDWIGVWIERHGRVKATKRDPAGTNHFVRSGLGKSPLRLRLKSWAPSRNGRMPGR